MKKTEKSVISFVVAIIIISIFAFIAIKIFPAETYSLKSYVFGLLSENNMPAPISDISAETQDLAELVRNGAVMNDTLMLINKEHPVPEKYEPAIADYNGILMSSSASDGYSELADKIKCLFDNSLYVMSAYRTLEEQLEIIKSGNEYAASLNSSEHLTGLALDVYVRYHAGMGFLDTPEGQFVNSHCQDFGFIIRYPDYGKEITGIDFEPWHIRYVGLPHSEIISENRLTLEEYVAYYKPGLFYEYNDYIIFRVPAENEIPVPKGLYNIVISPDNTGFYFITGKIR